MGMKLIYHMIEILVLKVVITTRKPRPYFQGYQVVVKMNYHIHKILNNHDLVGRMSWSATLVEHDINSIPRRSIKSQVLADFLVEFTFLTNENILHV